MKKPGVISTGENYTAVDIGTLSQVSDYSLIHPRTGKELHKIFLKEPTGSTSTEISVQTIEANNRSVPYFHIHNKNEETYLILRGEGTFHVDGDSFDVREGSVVRIAPSGVRGIANNSARELIYIVVQSRENSLEEYSSQDGRVVEPKAERE